MLAVAVMEPTPLYGTGYVYDRRFLYTCKEPHLTTTVWTFEWIHFVYFFDQPCPGATGVFDVFGKGWGGK